MTKDNSTGKEMLQMPVLTPLEQEERKHEH